MRRAPLMSLCLLFACGDPLEQPVNDSTTAETETGSDGDGDADGDGDGDTSSEAKPAVTGRVTDMAGAPLPSPRLFMFGPISDEGDVNAEVAVPVAA